MRDLFDKIYKDKGPLGKWADQAEGYFVFPKLEGPISNRMKFQGKDVVTWSINDYLGLANHPEVRKVDAEAGVKWGSAYPMGARMMSGHTELHEQLQRELAEFVQKEAAYLLNFGYQGMVSTIDALVSKEDRKSTRLNSSHVRISYAVFCLKKKKKKKEIVKIVLNNYSNKNLTKRSSRYLRT